MRNTIDIHSNDNALFFTGQCNNRCLMCCQPPTNKNDFDFFFKQNAELIKNAPENLTNIGITGGEPTLLGEQFFELAVMIRKRLPNATIHILSNGRQFADEEFVSRLKEVTGDNVLLGIPLHSDSCIIHDEITQVKGSYNETMLGLYNLAAYNMPIELRVVINKLNYRRLPQLSSFIYKNLTFVNCISLMAMEYIGFSVKNAKQIWIEPLEYISYLKKATLNLSSWGMDVSIFNLPLCLLPDELHSFARKSISDWKNSYIEVCEDCTKKEICCGLFSTSKQPFEGLKSYCS
jgi:His-Xaa-Ser system radical SAM maturase HxsC